MALAEREPAWLRFVRIKRNIASQSVFSGIDAAGGQGFSEISKVHLDADLDAGGPVCVAVEFDREQRVVGTGLDGTFHMGVHLADFEQGSVGAEKTDVERNPSVLHQETLPFRAFGEEQHAMPLGQAFAVHQSLVSFLLRNDHLQLKRCGTESNGKPCIWS